MCYRYGFLKTKQMKKIKIFLITIVFFLLFTYLLGSFSQASFNIDEWSAYFRIPYALIAGLISVFLSFLISDTQQKHL